MRLSEWLVQTDMTQKQFAGLVGVQQAGVSKWISGRARPDWRALDRIVAVTDGAVTASDFHQPAPESAAAA